MQGFNYSSVRSTLYEPYILINVMTAPGGFFLKQHIHDFYHVNHVSSGSLTVEYRKCKYHLGAGCTFVLPPDIPHTISSEEGYVQIGIDVSQKKDSRGIVKALEDIITDDTLFSKRHPIKITPEEMTELINSPTERNLMRITHHADGIILDAIESAHIEDTDFDAKFKKMLTDSTPWKLTLSDMCRILGMSRTQLEKHCSHSFGCGASEYCARLRCTAVCEHLWSDETLESIAAELCFCDAAHLSNFFKSRTGMTPGEYRKNLI